VAHLFKSIFNFRPSAVYATGPAPAYVLDLLW